MFFRRNLSLILTLLMCFALAVFVNAGNIQDNELTVSTVSGYALDKVTVEVNIDNKTGYANLEFALEFDKEKLEVVTAIGNGTVTKAADANANGRVRIAHAGVGNLTESGTILTVEFRIKANAPIGDIPLTLKIERGVHFYYSGADGMDMNFYEPVVTNGKITVLDNGWPVGVDLNIAEDSKYEYGNVPAVQFNDKVPAGAAATFTYKKWDGTAYVDAGTTPPTAIGKYEVTAGLELAGYNPLTIVRKYEITAIKTDTALLLDSEAVGAEGKEITYTGENHIFELSNITWTVPVYSCSTDGGATWVVGNSIRNAGTYTIKAVAEAENYERVEITRTVVIKKFDLTVEPTVRDKVYDGTTSTTIVGIITNPFLADVAVQLKAPSSVDFADANAGAKKAVSYDANGGFTLEGADAANFNFVNAKPAAFGTITPLEITVTPIAVQKLHTTEADPVIEYTYTPELIGNDKFEGALTRENAASNEVGVYEIIQGDLELSANYKIKFTEGVKFTILDKEYTRIEIVSEPKKTEYVEGQSFDADGLKIRAYYKKADGAECSKAEADLVETGYTWTPETFSTAGDKIPVTVSYGGHNAVVEVKVTANALKDITINENDIQKIFKIGSAFSTEGLKVTAYYTNFPEKGAALASDKFTVSVDPVYDANKIGKYTVTVSHTYRDVTKSVSYVVEVVEKEVTKIEVTAGKDAVVQYVANGKNTFSDKGFTVTAFYDNNTSEAVANYTFAPKGADANRALTSADQYITFKYTFGGKTVEKDYQITVLDNDATGIAVDASKTRKDYIEGNDFDPTGTVVTVAYRDGSTKTISEKYAENGIIFAPAKVSLDTKEITVKYGSFSAIIPVKVAAKKVVSIEITDAAETAIDGDTGASVIKTVKAVYDNGEIDNDFKGYNVFPETFTLDDKTEEKTVQVAVDYKNEGDTSFMLDFVDVKVLPREAKNETTGKNYRYFTDAVAEAGENDVIAVMNDVVIAEDLRIEKSITIKIIGNNTLTTAENVTVITAKKVKLKFDTSTAESALEINVNGKDIVVDAGVEEFVVKTSDIGSVARQISNAYKYIDRFYRDIAVGKTENGTINGRVSVKVGESAKFTITADAGYVIEDVIVDGESVGAVAEYVFEDVRSPHTISAVFAEKAE